MMKNITCGPWRLIEDGFERFIREHGCKPAALILHHAHLKPLYFDTRSEWSLLDGIRVIVSRRFTVPVLMDDKGNHTGCSPITARRGGMSWATPMPCTAQHAQVIRQLSGSTSDL